MIQNFSLVSIPKSSLKRSQISSLTQFSQNIWDAFNLHNPSFFGPAFAFGAVSAQSQPAPVDSCWRLPTTKNASQRAQKENVWKRLANARNASWTKLWCCKNWLRPSYPTKCFFCYGRRCISSWVLHFFSICSSSVPQYPCCGSHYHQSGSTDQSDWKPPWPNVADQS